MKYSIRYTHFERRFMKSYPPQEGFLTGKVATALPQKMYPSALSERKWAGRVGAPDTISLYRTGVTFSSDRQSASGFSQASSHFCARNGFA